MSANRARLDSCCTTTPSAIYFWTTMFVLAYGATLVLQWVWPALGRFGDALLLTALGAACVLNAVRNRTYHCVLTAPLFLGAAIAAAVADAGVWHVPLGLFWGVVAAGVGAAFLTEWRAARESRS